MTEKKKNVDLDLLDLVGPSGEVQLQQQVPLFRSQDHPM